MEWLTKHYFQFIQYNDRLGVIDFFIEWFAKFYMVAEIFIEPFSCDLQENSSYCKGHMQELWIVNSRRISPVKK